MLKNVYFTLFLEQGKSLLWYYFVVMGGKLHIHVLENDSEVSQYKTLMCVINMIYLKMLLLAAANTFTGFCPFLKISKLDSS